MSKSVFTSHYIPIVRKTVWGLGKNFCPGMNFSCPFPCLLLIFILLFSNSNNKKQEMRYIKINMNKTIRNKIFEE